MFVEYVREIVSSIDQTATSRADALRRLRVLGLDDFGAVLWSMPNPHYPHLSELLPAMASEEAQRNWTGNSGAILLKQSTDFVRSVAYNFAAITGQSLKGARILDYGCGYGRIARLMYSLADEEKVFGVDPWDESIKLCTQAGMAPAQFVQSEYLPQSLPVKGKFHLVYAFSVFTHLSLRATFAALKAIRKSIHDSGVLVITIRPIEYWAHHPDKAQGEQMIQLHREQGFAFAPNIMAPVDGDVTYGNTSMTLDWLEKNCPEWNIVGQDRTMDDPFQRYIFLRPKF